MNVTTLEAQEFFQRGLISLAQVEANGICLDVPYLQGAIRKMEKRIKRLEAELRADEVYKQWERHFKDKATLGSYPQLAVVVYDILGYECHERTATNRPKADKNTLERLDHPFIKKWLRLKKLEKANSTYLVRLLREAVNGKVHPVFNLHFVETFRSSSHSPNIQNQPNRDQEIAEIIRRSFVSSGDDYVFLEIDLSQAEVRASCAYHHDPVLINYVSGGGDMHFDMSLEIFKLKKAQVSKPIRQNTKNQFVFPEFYGSYYAQTAAGMWDYIGRNGVTLSDGTCLYQHLKSKGISTLGDCQGRPQPGTFEHHVQKVEDKFWNERLKVYTDWKKQWYAAYQKTGGFRLLTGFWVEGIMSRNECLNTPIQGVAFHWLLWSLIRLQDWLNRKRMRTKIVGQVHDSLLIDCHKHELPDVLEMAYRIFTKLLPQHWDWIVTPIEVEAEASPPGGSWYEKSKVAITA